jgi:hypothetical protein
MECARPNISTVFFYLRASNIRKSGLNRRGKPFSNLAAEEVLLRSIATVLSPNRLSLEISYPPERSSFC